MLTKTRILKLVPVALAIVAGVCAVLATGIASKEFVDSVDYLAAARMIVEQGRYPDVGTLPFFRAPLYPGFIALIWSIVPGGIAAIKIVQIAIFAASAFVVSRTAAAIAKNEWTAFAAGTIFAVNPFFAYEAAAIQTECLQIFLLATAFYFTVRLLMAEELKLAQAVPLGVVLGLASLNKPSVLGATVVLAAVIWLFKRKVANSRLVPVATVAVALTTILPWSMYVYQTKGEFFLVNDAGGYNSWSGNLPSSVEYYETTFANSADASAWGEQNAQQQIAEWESTVGYANLTLKQREALWASKAFENMSAQPAAIAKLWGYKLASFWKPFLSSSIYSPQTVLLSAAVMVPLFAFGFMGLMQTIRNSETSSVGWMFVGIALFATVVHVALVSNLRLRLPYIDPMLTVLAGVSVYELAVKFFRKIRPIEGSLMLEAAAL